MLLLLSLRLGRQPQRRPTADHSPLSVALIFIHLYVLFLVIYRILPAFSLSRQPPELRTDRTERSATLRGDRHQRPGRHVAGRADSRHRGRRPPADVQYGGGRPAPPGRRQSRGGGRLQPTVPLWHTAQPEHASGSGSGRGRERGLEG